MARAVSIASANTDSWCTYDLPVQTGKLGLKGAGRSNNNGNNNNNTTNTNCG